MRLAITIMTMVFVTALYWMWCWLWQCDLRESMIGQFLCHLVIVCTAIILKKIDSLKPKDEKKD